MKVQFHHKYKLLIILLLLTLVPKMTNRYFNKQNEQIKYK